MRERLTLFGLAALLLLLAGCAEEIEAPTDVWVGREGTIETMADPIAEALNPSDADGAQTLIYLPDGYSASGDAYPVVYMLHGYGGDENMFPTIFGITALFDEMIASEVVEPFVAVFPNGDNELAGTFYQNSPYPLVGASADRMMALVGSVEAAYNVSTDPAGKAICGLSMGGYGALSLALENAGEFGFVGVLSGPVSFWGERTADPVNIPNTDDVYAGIEELLPAVLAQGGFTPDPNWDPLIPDPDLTSAYQAAMLNGLQQGPPTSMMFAMAAAFSPGDPANPGPTYVQFDPNLPGVELPIGLDGEIFLPVWNLWMARDIIARLSTDPAQQAAMAGMDIYMACGLSDDLGLFGAHAVLATVLVNNFGVDFTAGDNVNRFFGTPNNPDAGFPFDGGTIDDVFGGFPAGHTEAAREELRLIVEWLDGKF